jgi:two-component system, NarL family, response regulator NreC
MPPDLRLAPLPTNVVGAFDPESIRVVLAEDHAAMRRNLRRLLDAEEGVTVVAEAIDLETAARRVYGYLPDVLILDLHLPAGSPVGLVGELRASVPETQVVMLTMENSRAFVTQALDAGAAGYVLKEHADRDLLPAVRAALRGESYVTPEVAEGLEARRRTAGSDSTTAQRLSVTR